jgi:hypothetical protein
MAILNSHTGRGRFTPESHHPIRTHRASNSYGCRHDDRPRSDGRLKSPARNSQKYSSHGIIRRNAARDQDQIPVARVGVSQLPSLGSLDIQGEYRNSNLKPVMTQARLQRLVNKPFLARKEMAEVTGLSYDTLVANEHTLGLDIACRQINAKCFVYDTLVALNQLLLRGMLPSSLTHLEIRERGQT